MWPGNGGRNDSSLDPGHPLAVSGPGAAGRSKVAASSPQHSVHPLRGQRPSCQVRHGGKCAQGEVLWYKGRQLQFQTQTCWENAHKGLIYFRPG